MFCIEKNPELFTSQAFNKIEYVKVNLRIFYYSGHSELKKPNVRRRSDIRNERSVIQNLI